MNPISIVENKDCLEAMRAFPDKFFDLCFTDPPFGVRSDDWDSMDEYEFARFSMAWLSEAKRISRNIVLFCNDGNILETLLSLLYPNVRKALWHKPLGSQYAGSSEAKLFFSYETILFGYEASGWESAQPKDLAVANLIKGVRQSAGLSRGGIDMIVRGKKTGLCYRWEEAACLPTDAQIDLLNTQLDLPEELFTAIREAKNLKAKSAEKADVFIYRTVTDGIHPCQKPVTLLKDLLDTFGHKSKTVIDPFLGSGSSRIAAYDLGFDFWGFEKDFDYYTAQEERFQNHIKQPKLFEPIKETFEQVQLF